VRGTPIHAAFTCERERGRGREGERVCERERQGEYVRERDREGGREGEKERGCGGERVRGPPIHAALKKIINPDAKVFHVLMCEEREWPLANSHPLSLSPSLYLSLTHSPSLSLSLIWDPPRRFPIQSTARAYFRLLKSILKSFLAQVCFGILANL